MPAAKLVALDQDDLNVISAHVQDSVLKVGDLVYRAREKQFVAGMNRFVWETALGKGGGKRNERRRAVLHFGRVLGCQTQNIDPDDGDAVLALLALTFEPSDAPAGVIGLVFAGGAQIRLEVECIEAQLSDLGAAWATHARPRHQAAG